jgi:hypothetical protein
MNTQKLLQFNENNVYNLSEYQTSKASNNKKINSLAIWKHNSVITVDITNFQ